MWDFYWWFPTFTFTSGPLHAEVDNPKEDYIEHEFYENYEKFPVAESHDHIVLIIKERDELGWWVFIKKGAV